MRPFLWRIFAKSPFALVQQHMRSVLATASLVEALFDALIAGDQPKVVDLAKQISIFEGEADAIKSSVRDHLPKGLFMPVDRSDVLRSLSAQDAIADCAEDLGVLLTMRTMEVPAWMAPVLRAYVKQALVAVDKAHGIIQDLDVLVEAGFRGPAADKVHDEIDALNLAEHNADKLQDQIAKLLFAHEDELKPVAVFMWSKVFNKIGDLANHAENVGDRMRLFIATK